MSDGKWPGLAEGQIFVKHLVDWTLRQNWASLGPNKLMRPKGRTPPPPQKKTALDAPKSHHFNDLWFH